MDERHLRALIILLNLGLLGLIVWSGVEFVGYKVPAKYEPDWVDLADVEIKEDDVGKQQNYEVYKTIVTAFGAPVRPKAEPAPVIEKPADVPKVFNIVALAIDYHPALSAAVFKNRQTGEQELKAIGDEIEGGFKVEAIVADPKDREKAVVRLKDPKTGKTEDVVFSVE